MVWHALCRKHFKQLLNKETDGWCRERDIGGCCYEDCDEQAEYELYPNLVELLEKMKKEKFVPLKEDDIFDDNKM